MLSRHLFLILALCCIVTDTIAKELDTETISLTLDSAEQQLLSNNPDIAIRHATVANAEAGVQSANTRPNPILSLSTAAIDSHDGIGSGHLGDKRVDSILSLSQVFERGDKRELRTHAATANLAAAQSDLADTLRQQRIAVAAAFYDLLAAQQRAALAVESARFARRSAKVAETRLAAGDLARIDVARAHTDAARAEADADQAQGDLRQAQTLLAALLDMRKQVSKLRAEGSWPSHTGREASAEFDLDALLARRPDVAAARARVEAALAARDLARAQKSRDVTVGGQVEHNPLNSQPTHSPLYGLSISIPLLFGNDYRGDIAKAETDYTAALETLRKVEIAARTDLVNRNIDVDTLGRRARRFSEELLPEARHAADAAEFSFEHGAMDIGDLLDARRTLKAAEQDTVATQDAYAKALYAWRIELADTVGSAMQETQKK